MWQVILFEYGEYEELEAVLRSLSKVATFREGTAFYFYSQLPGQPEFRFDCEPITGGLITSLKGDYFSFFGYFIDALISRFGTLEIGRNGALPTNP